MKIRSIIEEEIMKIEIKGSWHNRKLLIDGKDVTNNCESV